MEKECVKTSMIFYTRDWAYLYFLEKTPDATTEKYLAAAAANLEKEQRRNPVWHQLKDEFTTKMKT